MPLTLYRYILKDILKMLALSTGALVTVISFAAAIKPLSDGLLDFGGLLKFVAVTSPTMLVYALPFSTAFAVTLAFSRLANDNEITACSAGGLSYTIILLPVALLGAVLMLFLFVMSNWVLPPFNQMALSLIQKDAMRVLVHQLRQGEPVVMGDYKIFALEAEEAPPPRLENSPLQPDQLVLLRGVAVGKLNPLTQETLSDHTAEEADILVFRDGGRTWVQFRLKNPLYYDENDATGSLAVGAKQAEMLPNVELPNRFKDKAKTMTWGELSAISADPQKHPRSVAEREKLVEVMLDEELLARVELALRDHAARYTPPSPQSHDGEIRGVRMNGALEQEYFIISAPQVVRKDHALIIAGSATHPLRIDHYEQGRLTRRFESQGESIITSAPMQAGTEPRIAVEMRDVMMIDPRRADRTTERKELRLNRMWWTAPITPIFAQTSSTDLIKEARQKFPDSRQALKAAKSLDTHLNRLVNRVIAEFHERAATAFGCMLAAILGALLSIRLRSRVPLVVYFWTFLAVLGTTIVLQTGSRLAGDASHSLTSGLAILWSGAVALAGIIGFVFAKVSKN